METRVVLWNVRWQRAATEGGKAIRSILSEAAPDFVCLTEANRDLFDEGYPIVSDPDHGMPIKPGRHKVLLWSRQPWALVDDFGCADLPAGRFVRGDTDTPIGQLSIFGVCIPWSMAHVTTGRRDRAPWQDHLHYLQGLEAVLAEVAARGRAVVLGDFNQTVPRTRAPKRVFDQLTRTFGQGWTVATGQMPASGPWPIIDHLAHGPDLEMMRVEPLPNSVAGRWISDHVGMLITLRRRPGRGEP